MILSGSKEMKLCVPKAIYRSNKINIDSQTNVNISDISK